ncbi:unnamed protein product, partial [Ectocarpus sp. 4 AP-2014]
MREKEIRWTLLEGDRERGSETESEGWRPTRTDVGNEGKVAEVLPAKASAIFVWTFPWRGSSPTTTNRLKLFHVQETFGGRRGREGAIDDANLNNWYPGQVCSSFIYHALIIIRRRARTADDGGA